MNSTWNVSVIKALFLLDIKATLLLKNRCKKVLSSFMLMCLLCTSATVFAKDSNLAQADGTNGVNGERSNNDAAATIEVDIPYTKYILDNGLTLVVHEDHKAPLVAVNLWYHVGSKNEQPGKTGFAHLFEHLMFNGSENYNDEFFGPFEKVGATDMNGTTSKDRTNYFETVPKNALDLALWMESDRMGHLLGVVDQARLDEQRGVVQNEKRQGENQPYGKVWQLITENSYPQGHPYSWSTIGSMEDLNAASLDDVKEWFETYYGAANTTLVVAGDVDPEDVKARVEKYFGHIAPGPVVTQPAKAVQPMLESKRIITQDKVAQARIYKVWNVPEWGAADNNYLELAANVLSSGKNSRLYQRLVYEDQMATDASAYVMDGELGSQFMLIASARPGIELNKIEKALDEELNTFIQQGPTADELKRVRTQLYAGFVRGVQRVGGHGGKANILARSETYGGSPGAWKQNLLRLNRATSKQVQQAAQTWLTKGSLALEVHPQKGYKTSEPQADRSQLPQVGKSPDLVLPEIQRFTLSNGLEVVFAERNDAPLIEMQLLVDAGFAADKLPGVASMTMNMLDEGVAGMSSLEFAAEAEKYGAKLGASADLDTATIYLSALTGQIEPSLKLYSQMLLQPDFPEKELKRLKQQRLAAIAQEKTQPVGMILRQLPPLLYGDDHAYSQPLTGNGTVASTNAMTRKNLLDYWQSWVRPDNGQLLVVGDIKQAQLKRLLEQYFGTWQAPKQPLPTKNITDLNFVQPRIVLIDKPGAQQSTIIAGHIAPKPDAKTEIGLDAMNRALGGMFTSRLNLNLREDKHWSYGARTLLTSALGPRMFIAYAPVETPQTVPAMQEIMREMREYIASRPITAEELDKVQRSMTLKLPGENETLGEVAGTLADLIVYKRPDDYYTSYVTNVNELTTEKVADAARSLIHVDKLVWLIVGDLSIIEQLIRDAGIGPVEVLTSE